MLFIVFQYTIKSTNTEAANFAKHNIYVTANTFGHSCEF